MIKFTHNPEIRTIIKSIRRNIEKMAIRSFQEMT
jgi:hypothetical protein